MGYVLTSARTTPTLQAFLLESPSFVAMTVEGRSHSNRTDRTQVRNPILCSPLPRIGRRRDLCGEGDFIRRGASAPLDAPLLAKILFPVLTLKEMVRRRVLK